MTGTLYEDVQLFKTIGLLNYS